MDEIIAQKVDRLRKGPPKVLDLFAGCGGLSLGFSLAGYEISAAVENDPLAAKSHGLNFFKDDPEEQRSLHSTPRDITLTDPEQLVRELGLGSPSEAFDVIIGGPPCQAYARVGRAKLREIAEHPEAFKVDPRANLYLRYLHYVSVLKPVAILMENVPDILNFGGHNLGDEICDSLEALGYQARYTLLNSAHHGVPQMRDRVFILALHRALRTPVSFPEATHRCKLPAGYKGTRAVALKHINPLFGGRYSVPDEGHDALPPAISAADALGDLPPITLHLEGRLKRGARRFDEPVAYGKEPTCEYQRQMRDWPTLEGRNGIYDHVIRYLPRDTDIFRNMAPGDEYPAAHRVAVALFERRAAEMGLKPETDGWSELKRKMVPPYPVKSFPNRWWKMCADRPVRTLMAHLGKDCYSHIHYDSEQARTLSVREAARLQSFPDGFVFAGTMNPAFRQIGNAVPPLLAYSIAAELLRSLHSAASISIQPAVAA